MVAAVVRSGQSKKNPTWQTEGARAINRATHSYVGFRTVFVVRGEERNEACDAIQSRFGECFGAVVTI